LLFLPPESEFDRNNIFQNIFAKKGQIKKLNEEIDIEAYHTDNSDADGDIFSKNII
jgi:hypothetical protein